MARNLRCNLTPERMDEVFGFFESEFDFCPDYAEESQMLGVFPQYLFYDTPFADRKIRSCFCTSCGGFDMFRDDLSKRFFASSHGDDIDCPNCGNSVTLKALGRMASFSTINNADERRFSIFRAAPDGGLMVVSGWGRRKFSLDDLRGELFFREKERQYFAPGERMRWKRHWTYDGLCNHGTARTVGWDPCDFMAEPHNPTINLTSDGSYYVICAERIADTKLKYCRIEDWYHDRCKVWLSESTEPCRYIHKYLSLYTEYPLMEMACRLGFWDAVDDLVDHNKKNADILDWNAETSWGFLRLNKPDGKQFLERGSDLDDLKLLSAARKFDKKLTLAKFWELIEKCGNDAGMVTLIVHSSSLSRQSPQTVIHYLEKIPGVPTVNAQMLCDYLDFAKALKYDLRRQDVALPKDLKERHDAASEASMLLRQQQAKSITDRRVQSTMQMYEFSYGGYSIIVPESVEDIVNEGKKLQHCVGGYAARHFSGALEILFLRKTSAIRTPLITLELAHRDMPRSKVHIRQMYGNRNSPARQQFKWFIDVWTEWLLQGSPRDKSGAPIIPVVEEVSA